MIASKLTLNKVDPRWDRHHFRAKFKSTARGEWNTYKYYVSGGKLSNTPFDGANIKSG